MEVVCIRWKYWRITRYCYSYIFIPICQSYRFTERKRKTVALNDTGHTLCRFCNCRIHMIQFEGLRGSPLAPLAILAVRTSRGRQHTSSVVRFFFRFILYIETLKLKWIKKLHMSIMNILTDLTRKTSTPQTLTEKLYSFKLSFIAYYYHLSSKLYFSGQKRGNDLVTSACSWIQKICTITSFQRFALKTGLYKTNCQCKVNSSINYSFCVFYLRAFKFTIPFELYTSKILL